MYPIRLADEDFSGMLMDCSLIGLTVGVIKLEAGNWAEKFLGLAYSCVPITSRVPIFPLF